jgi:hypothetical protein
MEALMSDQASVPNDKSPSTSAGTGIDGLDNILK